MRVCFGRHSFFQFLKIAKSVWGQCIEDLFLQLPKTAFSGSCSLKKCIEYTTTKRLKKKLFTSSIRWYFFCLFFWICLRLCPFLFLCILFILSFFFIFLFCNQILLHFEWPARYMYLSLSILLNLSLTFFVFVPFFFFISFLCNQMLLHFEWPARYLLQRTEFKSERACCQSSSTYSCKEYLKYL